MSPERLVYIQAEAVYEPLVDLYETDESLVFEVELPGIDPGDVLVKVYDDIVIIDGVKREIREGKLLGYVCMERKFASFRRVLRIPVAVNAQEGRASYNEGVLTVTFPKLKNKVIRIKIET